MNRMRMTKSTGLLALVLPLLGAMTGCFQPEPPPPPPPPEAVLAGNWALTGTGAPEITELQLSFDSNGNLVRITYKLGNLPTIVDDNPDGSTSVNGSDVVISVNFGNNAIVFGGTMNAGNNQIFGHLTTFVSVGGITVSISNGPATLTRV